eukprot:TRINITY_DN3432_c0_g1_i1.p2 TRINITY_DN3432_c0_g1~~TRINITY_DN3432_c0_g1_i1.p2  ORF type:complete len:128 (+),score=3.67 TRINITY_DN3432_c0_g1_i1:207-590(+)
MLLAATVLTSLWMLTLLLPNRWFLMTMIGLAVIAVVILIPWIVVLILKIRKQRREMEAYTSSLNVKYSNRGLNFRVHRDQTKNYGCGWTIEIEVATPTPYPLSFQTPSSTPYFDQFSTSESAPLLAT